MSTSRSRLGWTFWLPAVAVSAGLGAGAWYKYSRTELPSLPLGPTARAGEGTHGGVSVDVITPQPGGIERVCVQPGTVEPFESADLFAKVSGFLAEQSVDIGTRVKRGQVLARISLPEFEKQAIRDAAKVDDAKAKVQQAEARVKSAQADYRAARAQVAFTEADVKAKSAYREFRQKQANRMKELSAQSAIDERVVDEKEDQYQAAVGAELAAKERINTAKSQAEAAQAKIAQAQADLAEAKADVGVADAELEKTKVWLNYGVITSPYDGVITRRSFFPGDFIRSAEAGGVNTPLLSVDRTDKMRVVVQVPDRDVPYVTVGDPVTLHIDALPGRTFSAKVSRYAQSEDPSTRLMRTEVDVPNPDGVLSRGMYGRATIVLDAGAPHAVRIPSTAVAERGADGRAAVRVVRDGRVHLAHVTLGSDNGIEVEVTSGLAPSDRVVVRSSAPVQEGTEVNVSEAAGEAHAAAGH